MPYYTSELYANGTLVQPPLYANGNAIYRVRGNNIDFFHKFNENWETATVTVSCRASLRVVARGVVASGSTYNYSLYINQGAVYVDGLRNIGSSTMDVRVTSDGNSNLYGGFTSRTWNITNGRYWNQTSNYYDTGAQNAPLTTSKVTVTLNFVNAQVLFPSGNWQNTTATVTATVATVDAPAASGSTLKNITFSNVPIYSKTTYFGWTQEY